jgi:hypothetical protein
LNLIFRAHGSTKNDNVKKREFHQKKVLRTQGIGFRKQCFVHYVTGRKIIRIAIRYKSTK